MAGTCETEYQLFCNLIGSPALQILLSEYGSQFRMPPDTSRRWDVACGWARVHHASCKTVACGWGCVHHGSHKTLACGWGCVHHASHKTLACGWGCVHHGSHKTLVRIHTTCTVYANCTAHSTATTTTTTTSTTSTTAGASGSSTTTSSASGGTDTKATASASSGGGGGSDVLIDLADLNFGPPPSTVASQDLANTSTSSSLLDDIGLLGEWSWEWLLTCTYAYRWSGNVRH